jgi:hypothetical protein
MEARHGIGGPQGETNPEVSGKLQMEMGQVRLSDEKRSGSQSRPQPAPGYASASHRLQGGKGIEGSPATPGIPDGSLPSSGGHAALSGV